MTLHNPEPIDSAQGKPQFETTEFLFAAFLRASGVLYICTDWHRPGQATFVFNKPPDALLIAWQKAEDIVSARALYDSINFFRDEMRRTRNA